MFSAVKAVALLVTFLAPGSANLAIADAPTYSWKDVDRVVAFADVHGAYDELVGLLKTVGVVDAGLHWAGGQTHLVSLGDLLDRGAGSRKVMDLLMRLQVEAVDSGGQVHVVLGNHEAMNVLGDLRYVYPGEYAAYIPDEAPGLRAARRAEFFERHPDASAADFDQQFPPGYFGHRAMLGPDGPYGRWLLSLPVAIVVNDTVYMHGGPSAVLYGSSIEQLNLNYRAALRDYLANEEALDRAGLLQFEDDYGKRSELAEQRLEAGAADAGLAAAVSRFRAADDNVLLGPAGPNWYRGAAYCNECAESDVLKPWLQQIGVDRVVIGHTVARNATVVARFDGAVVKLDAGMNRAVYKGRPAALISDATGSHVVYGDGPAVAGIVPEEPLFLSSQTLGEDQVLEILKTGAIEVVETCAPDVLDVRVSAGGRSVRAVFEAASTDQANRELAAYRVDRLLDLGLVPATTVRTRDGIAGILQGRPEHWISEQDRVNAKKGERVGLACQTITSAPQAAPARRALPVGVQSQRWPAGGWCDAGAQVQLAYAFDALIGNRGRSLDRYLYDTDSWTLFLSGHAQSFPATDELTTALADQLPRTGPEMRQRLKKLDSQAVERELDELLTPREIKALLKRRDRVLQLAGAVTKKR
jgi:hypothetical protein